jgi:hypothetical protein
MIPVGVDFCDFDWESSCNCASCGDSGLGGKTHCFCFAMSGRRRYIGRFEPRTSRPSLDDVDSGGSGSANIIHQDVRESNNRTEIKRTAAEILFGILTTTFDAYRCPWDATCPVMAVALAFGFLRLSSPLFPSHMWSAW